MRSAEVGGAMAAQPHPTSRAQAAARRQARAAAAAFLAHTPRRAQLGWDDLAAWPAWAGWPTEQRERLQQAAGAWYAAGALRQCIDGRVLQRLAGLLGEAEADRLLQADAGGEAPAVLPNVAPSFAPNVLPNLAPALLADQLGHTGREVLLAAVASPALRLVLREAFWPATRAPLPALDTAAAGAALQAALQARPQPEPQA